eukprot:NP_494347.1 Uncharacterized protein CELE_F29A7.5 [Caenorhabditis elegans]
MSAATYRKLTSANLLDPVRCRLLISRNRCRVTGVKVPNPLKKVSNFFWRYRAPQAAPGHANPAYFPEADNFED